MSIHFNYTFFGPPGSFFPCKSFLTSSTITTYTLAGHSFSTYRNCIREWMSQFLQCNLAVGLE